MITLMMEVVSTSETSVNFYETTWHNILEDSHRYGHCFLYVSPEYLVQFYLAVIKSHYAAFPQSSDRSICIALIQCRMLNLDVTSQYII
jgi:hypothetical protein